MNSNTRRLVLTAVMAAIITVFTAFFAFPLPVTGYFNAGDSVVMLAAFLLPAWWAAAAAAVGSALADLIMGYAVYAPATLIIKGLMALVAAWVLQRKSGSLRLVVCVGIFMAAVAGGYFAYEWMIYDFAGAIAGVIPNLIQAAAGGIVGTVLGVAARPLFGTTPQKDKASKYTEKQMGKVLGFTLSFLGIAGLIYALIEKNSDDYKAQKLLDHAVTAADAIFVASLVIMACGGILLLVQYMQGKRAHR